MSKRIIRSDSGTKILVDSIVSILVMEAITPSKELYIILPQLSDAPLIDNSSKNFADLFPFADTPTIFLSDILYTIAFKGSSIKIITDQRTSLIDKLTDSEEAGIEWRYNSELRETGVITSNVYLSGTIKFHSIGVQMIGEHLKILTEPSEVSQALNIARVRWEESDIC